MCPHHLHRTGAHKSGAVETFKMFMVAAVNRLQNPLREIKCRFMTSNIANMVNWDKGSKPGNLSLIQQLGKQKVASRMVEHVPSTELAYSKASIWGLQQVCAQLCWKDAVFDIKELSVSLWTV